MIYLYRFVYLVLKTLVITLHPILGAQTQKWVSLRSQIFSLKWKSLSLQNTVWIHASSGEIEYAKPLIREIKLMSPQTSLVVTYSSESAEKLFENVRDLVDFFIPLPWDDVYSTRFLIKKLNPQILIFSRTDLWPELMYQAHEMKIPMGVISYFPKFSAISKFILSDLLSKLSFISCVDLNTEKQIESLALKAYPLIATHGDARFDQVFNRLESAPQIHLKPNLFTLCMGSTWPEDEEVLCPLFENLLKQNTRLILCPHDVSSENINRITHELNNRNLNFSLLSELNLSTELDFQFLLVDRIGFLADLYRFSSLAFVGGSFKNRVHSVMEPLCCGLPVITGPLMTNNPEALKYSQAHFFKAVYICEDSKQIQDVITHLKDQNQVHQSNAILSEMKKNKGATKNIINFILGTVLKKLNF